MHKTDIQLSPSQETDLLSFFEFQLDPEANHLAAFTSKDSQQKESYLAKYTPFLSDPGINMKTIRVGSQIVGSISKFMMHNEAELTYWIDKKYWGLGIGTAALTKFLTLENSRPLYARVAFDNVGSQKVLEKCGFIKIGTDKGFAYARQTETEEFIYKLQD